MSRTIAENGEPGGSSRFGKLEFLLVILIPFVGLLLAAWMYFYSMPPEGRTNKGNLLSPPLSLDIFESPEITIEQLDQRWGVVVASGAQCDEVCRNMLYLVRQSHIALDRDAPRVQRFLLTPEPERVMTEEFTSFLEQEHADVKLARGTMPVLTGEGLEENTARVFLVDPLGNIILWYGKAHDGKEILKDLEKLLKLSRIG